MFRTGHLATTFDNADLTPPTKFPINGYDIDDPGVDLDTWTLNVTGAVQKPGPYKLSQVQALPRVRQNTRHVCVEGWDVIGQIHHRELRRRLLRIPGLGDGDASPDFALLRNV
jgi:hypothetical protein